MSGQNSPVPVHPDDTNVLLAWLRDIVRQLQLAWRLFWDKRVSVWLKLIPPAAILYTLLPVDILPDVVPGAGQLDDVAIVLLGIKLFIELVPPEIRLEHLRALGAKVPNWRVVPEENQGKPEAVEGLLQPGETESPLATGESLEE